MIKIGNHIRFGKYVVIVENINDDKYLLREPVSGIVNWVSKNILMKSIVPMTFKNQLFESNNQYTNVYECLTNDVKVSIKPYENGSKISIIEEGREYFKFMPYNTSRTKYEFNKYFNYINELTPYKLEKYGFQKKEV